MKEIVNALIFKRTLASWNRRGKSYFTLNNEEEYFKKLFFIF